MNVVVWDVNHCFDSSEDVSEGDHGEEGHGDHDSVSWGDAVNVGEEINSSHGNRTTAVSGLGGAAGADLGLASAVLVEVIGDVVNAIAGSGGSVGVLVAVELDVTEGTVGWAAEALSLSAVSVGSAPWSGCAVTGGILGGNGREEAGSEGEGDELVHLIYLYYYNSLFDNSQDIKRRKDHTARMLFSNLSILVTI
jgi:hypothetical protein